MAFETILYEVEDGILTITLNRPDRLNAFNNEMRDEVIAALDLADADDEVKAIIFTGSGRAFCAGADLGGGGDTFNYKPKTPGIPRDGGGMLTLRIFECLKPVISACNGPAVGIGATMQCAMDIRLASENAKYGFVFSKRGIVPEAASSWFLPRVVGISTALEWTFSGRVFEADEALERGFVRTVYPADELLPGADHPMEAHQIDSRGVYFTGKSADAQEGVRSFLEKRPASYPGQVSSDMPEFFPWWEEREYK